MGATVVVDFLVVTALVVDLGVKVVLMVEAVHLADIALVDSEVATAVVDLVVATAVVDLEVATAVVDSVVATAVVDSEVVMARVDSAAVTVVD